MKTGTIIFKLELGGRGIVNFDDPSTQKKFIVDHCGSDKKIYHNNNIKVGKKAYTKRAEPTVIMNEDGEVVRVIDVDYNLKISSNCLRHEIFVNDAEIQNVKSFLSDFILSRYTTSVQKLLQGYTCLSQDDSLTRKGALSITDALENSGAQIFMECHSNSGPKEKTSDEGSTSLFFSEQVGDTSYEAYGSISLKELQFISADPFFGRLRLKPEWFEGDSPLIVDAFKSHYGVVPFKTGYYTSSTAVYGKRLAEFGIRLSDDFVKFLVREQLKRILDIYINRAGAVAYTTKLKIKLVKDCYGANFRNNEGWIEITSENVDSLDFDMFNFFDECTEEEISATKAEIDKAEIISAKLKEEKKPKKNKKK